MSILNLLHKLSKELDVPGYFDLANSRVSMILLSIFIIFLLIFLSSWFKKVISKGALCIINFFPEINSVIAKYGPQQTLQ